MRVKPISGFYIDLKKSEKYSKVEECNMSTNCVGTYEQYKERLLKMKPNVYPVSYTHLDVYKRQVL